MRRIWVLILLTLVGCSSRGDTRAELIRIHNATLQPGNRAGIERLQEALIENPDDAELMNLLGIQYMVQGQLDAAHTMLDLANQVEESSEALANLARVRIRLGRAAAAEDAIRRYEARVGEDAIGQRLRAQWSLLERRLEDALAYTRRAHELSPDPITTRELADMLVRCGEHEEAIAHYQQLVDADAPGAAIRGNMAYALLATGQCEDAVETALEAISEDETYAPAWRTLGRAQTKLEQYDEALVSLENALDHANSPAVTVRVHYDMGETHLAHGNKERASESYWTALELLDPDGRIREQLPSRGTFSLDMEVDLMHKHLGEYLQEK